MLLATESLRKRNLPYLTTSVLIESLHLPPTVLKVKRVKESKGVYKSYDGKLDGRMLFMHFMGKAYNISIGEIHFIPVGISGENWAPLKVGLD